MGQATTTRTGTTAKIKLTSIYVDDQDKALRFYTDVLGLVKKADVKNGPYRWLTVASPEEPDGTELQLALNDNPAAKAYQRAMFEQDQPAIMFAVDDVQEEYERMTSLGASFTMPPTKVTGSTIAQVNDTSGNLVQITKLDRQSSSPGDEADGHGGMPIRIGTSGFLYDHWRGRLYEPRDRGRELEAYVRSFDTVELNVTFYRMPGSATFRSWAARVHPGSRSRSRPAAT